MTETKGQYIFGGNGSHWEGCENTHWDCRIARLEQENAELRSEIARLKKEKYREYCSGCINYQQGDSCLIFGVLKDNCSYHQYIDKSGGEP